MIQHLLITKKRKKNIQYKQKEKHNKNFVKKVSSHTEVHQLSSFKNSSKRLTYNTKLD